MPQPSPTPSSNESLLSDIYWLITTDYTSRHMTNPSDSLNALLGILSVWQRTLLPSGCIWGLPLTAHPPCLGWMHPRNVVNPQRRGDFPSWSWTGWAGEVGIDGLLLPGEVPRGMGVKSPVKDMTVAVLGVTGKTLQVEGWTVGLVIRAEPFADAVVGEEALGTVMERNFLPHQNRLVSGVYECLVVERVTYCIYEGGPVYQRVFMLVLDGDGVTKPAQRKTIVTLTTSARGDFTCAGPVRRRLVLA